MRRLFQRFTAEHELRNKKGRVTALLSVVILFLTVVALMLPAAALSKKEVVMDCPLTVHEHSASCYQVNEDGEKILTCGQADYVVHTHDESCYDDDGNLICNLPEVQEHIHDESCYEEQQVLVCDLEEDEDHTHTDKCYETEKVLICGQDELHTHDESCFDENGDLICGKVVLESHQHDESCFKKKETAEEDPKEEDTVVSGDASEQESEDQAPAAEISEPSDEDQGKDNAASEEESDPEAASDQKGDEDQSKDETEVFKTDLSDENKTLIFEESTAEVLVHVEADQNAFPEGTSMKVKAVADTEVTEPVSDVVEGRVQTIKAVDITFFNEKGDEIEPAGPIRVSMTSKGKYDGKENNIAIVHVDDTGKAEEVRKVDVEKKKKETTATFEVDEFSVYAVVYTVDFHWEVDGKKYEFSIPGGGFISLEHIVEAAGIARGDDQSEKTSDEDDNENQRSLTLEDIEVTEETKQFVADVDKVEFSTPELVWVGKVEKDTTVGKLKKDQNLEVEYSAELTEEEIVQINAQSVDAGNWALISLLPFVTEESLTVTMKNGDVFTIQVTDDQANDPLGLNMESFVITNSSHDRSLKAQADSNAGSLQAQNPPSADAINVWRFEYDQNAFNGTGGYYIVCIVNNETRYLRVDGNSLSLAQVKYEADATGDQTAATPFHVTYDHNDLFYRISGAENGNGKYLNYQTGGYNGRFNLSDTTNDSNKLQLRDKDQPTTTPGTIGTWDIKSDGITLKLFDYKGLQRVFVIDGWSPAGPYGHYEYRDVDSQWSPRDLDDLRVGTGINYDRSLLFSGSGISGSDEDFNNFTGDKTGGTYYSGVANQGIVKHNLGSDRFPVLKDENILTDTDEESGGSLGYLFDDNDITDAKTSYLGENNKGLQGLLRKDEDGYYYYDSEENFAKLVGDEIILYSDTYKKNTSSSTDVKTTKIGLFPFDDYQPNQGEEKGPTGSVYHHQFGMTISSNFVYPKNGIVPDTGKPMTFEFSGDDDVWVFVDGVLVLDLGGVHQPISGKIDFAEGKVYVTEFNSQGHESTRSVTMASMFEAASTEAGREIKFDTSEYSTHKIDFFYLERGGCDSNCKIKFNLLMMKTLTVAKKLNGLTLAERQKYLNDEFLYELGLKHNANDVHMEYDDENEYWEHEEEWRSGFSTYNTAKTDRQSDENHTIKTLADGTQQTGLPVSDGQITLKAGESMMITHLPTTDIFYLAEEDELDMQQFETPHAERIYQDTSDQKRHEEEVHLHEDYAAGGEHHADWETRPYALENTERLVYTNTLKEKNLDVEKQWSDILTDNHSDDEVEFKLKAWVQDGSEYKSYQSLTGYDSIYAQWTETTTSNGTPVTTTTTGDVLAQTFKLKANQDWKLSFEHLPGMTPSATDTGKEIIYTVEEVTKKNGYSSAVSPARETNEVYLDLFKFWPDGNEYHDGHTETQDGKTVEFPVEHITTYIKRSDGKYLQATRGSNGEYFYDNVTDDLDQATQFELVSKSQLPNNLKTNDQKEMFDYAARVNGVPAAEDGEPFTYSYYEKDDEDATTTGLVMFTRPKQEIEIYNDTSLITVDKEWLDADGNKLTNHPNSITFDVYRSYHKHDWGPWQTDTGSTTETRSCQYDGCTASETRTLDSGGHQWVKMRTVAPTCDSEGYDLYVCSKNPEHIEHRNSVPALGHDWPDRSQATVVKQATCTKEGLRKYICKRDGCNHEVMEAIAALGHTWSDWTYTKEPTDTETGEIKRECSRCGETETREIESGEDFPTDPEVETPNLPAEPVPFLPESLQSLNDPDKGNYVELFKSSETLETANNSPTKRTEGSSVYWTKDYTYPQYDTDRNEYTYYIFETSPEKGFKTTYTYYAGSYDQSSDSIAYRQVEGNDIHNYGKVRIANKQVADIDVFKISDAGKPLEGAVFKLEYKAPGQSSYAIVPVQAPGSEVTGVTFAPLVPTQNIQFDTTKQTFTIPAGGVKIDNLKEGMYKFVEVDAPEGYVILDNNTYIKVEFDNTTEELTISYVDENGNRIQQAATSKAELVDGALSIKNEPGASLPHTGGPGTTMFYLLGVVLAGLACAGLLIRRKRKTV